MFVEALHRREKCCNIGTKTIPLRYSPKTATSNKPPDIFVGSGRIAENSDSDRMRVMWGVTTEIQIIWCCRRALAVSFWHMTSDYLRLTLNGKREGKRGSTAASPARYKPSRCNRIWGHYCIYLPIWKPTVRGLGGDTEYPLAGLPIKLRSPSWLLTFF